MTSKKFNEFLRYAAKPDKSTECTNNEVLKIEQNATKKLGEEGGNSLDTS